MSEALAERALVRIVELLSGMTGPRHWGGSYPDAPDVHRKLHQPEQVTRSPHICVREDSGSVLEAVTFVEAVGTEAVIADQFAVAIYGHVIRDEVVSESTWLLRLRHDIRLTLLADLTLGGIARGLGFGKEEVDGGLLESKALIVMPVIVMLDEKFAVN